jgi:hypothetical protein
VNIDAYKFDDDLNNLINFYFLFSVAETCLLPLHIRIRLKYAEKGNISFKFCYFIKFKIDFKCQWQTSITLHSFLFAFDRQEISGI